MPYWEPPHGHNKSSSERRMRILSPEDAANAKDVDKWSKVDMAGVGLAQLAAPLFRMKWITALFLNNNNLTSIPGGIGQLSNLTVLDLSYNKLHSLPGEIGMCMRLKEINLYKNNLRSLPLEMGRLFQLTSLMLLNNPLVEPYVSLSQQNNVEAFINYLSNQLPEIPPPAEREWLRHKSCSDSHNAVESKRFTCFDYNILCDKYATPQMYGYCPRWALDWKVRREKILDEILHSSADIICLQEMEGGEFKAYFQPELHKRGYHGIFKPKSRARNMSEHDRNSVDGCATFFRHDKFVLVKEKLVEFERLATKHATGAADMLNRVMTKDNISLLTILRHKPTNRNFIVANVHLQWDPYYRDVKLVQCIMLLHEMEAMLKTNGMKDAPSLIMGDFNSLQDSGVFEYLDRGEISRKHDDLSDFKYEGFFKNVGSAHNFGLDPVFTDELPYTNFTFDFTGIIDYMWYSKKHLQPLFVLGPADAEYLKRVAGCPNAHFPSDHIPLVAEFEIIG